MSLSSEDRTRYVGIIDGILVTADLTTISAKQIRKGIESAIGHDINHQKDAIKQLILERFDRFNATNKSEAQTDGVEPGSTESLATPTPPTTNGHHASSPEPSRSSSKRQSESDLSDTREKPPKKKRKADTLDADAAMAARLQAEENARARPTRGGVNRKVGPVKKKTPKKKTPHKVRSDDDSDGDDSDGDKPQKNTGFHKPMMLSAPLSALLGGEAMLSRPQTVKRLWAHIKGNNLQDPNDKRQIICDEPMRAVFKQDKVHMFTMTKILNQNLYSPDE